MLNRGEALRRLRLEEEREYSEPELRAAFQKLAERYPLHHFPERFSALREALEYLIDPAQQYSRILRDDMIDLSFLAGYLNLSEVTEGLEPVSDTLLLENLLRLAVRGSD